MSDVGTILKGKVDAKGMLGMYSLDGFEIDTHKQPCRHL